MNWRRFRRARIVFPVFLAALWVFPVTWFAEIAGKMVDPEQALGVSDWVPLVVSLGLALLFSGAYWIYLQRMKAWRRRNGSLVYVGAMPHSDLDLERVQHACALANAELSPFDEPLRSRSDRIDRDTPGPKNRRILRTNFEFLLRADEPNSPTGLVANLPWPYAVAYGYDLAFQRSAASRQQDNLVIWHLRKGRVVEGQENQQWLGEELIDVIRVHSLKSIRTPARELARTDDASKELEGAKPEGIERSTVVVEVSEPFTTAFIHGQGHVVKIEVLPDTRTTGGGMHDPCRFAAIAQSVLDDLSQLIDRTEPNDVIRIAARMPKPIALAVGYGLGLRYPKVVDDNDNECLVDVIRRFVFLTVDGATEQVRELELGEPRGRDETA